MTIMSELFPEEKGMITYITILYLYVTSLHSLCNKQEDLVGYYSMSSSNCSGLRKISINTVIHLVTSRIGLLNRSCIVCQEPSQPACCYVFHVRQESFPVF